MSAPWIQSYNRGRIDLLAPNWRQVWLPDVVMSLSRLPRFTGHTTRVYTVLEHSIAVALECLVRALRGGAFREVAYDAAFMGLLHDASESATGDLSTPLKQALLDDVARAKLKRIEVAFERALCCHIAAPDRETHHRLWVKPADWSLLRYEAMCLLPGGPREDWSLPDHVQMPAIDVANLLESLPRGELGRRVAFWELHASLLHHTPLPYWTHAAGEEVAAAMHARTIDVGQWEFPVELDEVAHG